MPVPSIDQYFGFGKGDAQVYNTNTALNTFFKVQQQQQLRDEQDQKAVADMLSKVQPDKLRTNDMGEFNQKYSELKQLYATNKDLYRYPLRNQAAYNRSQQLVNELRTLNADSQAVEKWTSDVGKVYLSDKDKLEDGTVNLLGEVKGLPVSQIKAKLGGRLPDLTDVAFNPAPIDWEKLRKGAFEYGAAMGGVNDVPVTIKADGKNGIPVGQQISRIDKTLNPVVLGSYTEGQMLGDRNFKKTMGNNFKALAQDPAQLNAYNQDFTQRFPTAGFAVSDPLSYAKAEVIKRASMQAGTSKFQDDADYKATQKATEKDEQHAWEIKKMYLGNSLTRGNIELSHQLRDKEKTDKTKDETLLLSQGKDIVSKLQDPASNVSDLAKTYSKVIKVGQNVAGEPIWTTPVKNGKATTTPNGFWMATEARNKNVLEPKYAITKEDADQIYAKGLKIAYIPVWAPDKTDPTKQAKYYITINPLSYSANEDAYSILKMLGGTEKQGLKAK